MLTVFSTKTCVQCSATYRALDGKGIRYEVVDVENDPVTIAGLKAMGYDQLPVVLPADGPGWAGFRPDMIDALAQAITQG